MVPYLLSRDFFKKIFLKRIEPIYAPGLESKRVSQIVEFSRRSSNFKLPIFDYTESKLFDDLLYSIVYIKI